MPRLSQVIKDDHHRVIELRQRIFTSDDSETTEAELIQEIERHLVAEAQVLLPVLSDKLADGDQRSQRVRNAHENVQHDLAKQPFYFQLGHL